jgi:N-acetylmuramoyl-L-alanine amidase
MRSYIRNMILPTLCILPLLLNNFWYLEMPVNKHEQIEVLPIIKVEPITVVVEQPLEKVESTTEIEECVEDSELLSQEDIELIALVTMAEAEGECDEGKRLVIDTILNRMDSEYFPDTIHDVIYQPNQFSSMWNGRVERCTVSDDICELVEEELVARTNNDTIFFTAGDYGRYGTPMFQVGNHYFSSYD